MQDRVIAIIHRELTQFEPLRNDVAVAPEMSLIDDLDVDTLDRMCIVVALEEEFDIEIPDAAIEAWQTVADVIASVEAKRKVAL